MYNSKRVFLVVSIFLLTSGVVSGQNTYINNINSMGFPGNAWGSMGWQNPVVVPRFYYWYYDPWPWDNYSRWKHAQELEYRRELMGQRREEKAAAAYRNRTRINTRTGHVPVGPTMYD
jgi:hypothetical protein